MSSMREELDGAMAGVKLGEARKAAIRRLAAEEEKSMKKSALRPILIGAAILAVFTVSAFALAPSLREALADALGGFAPYSQTVEDVTAVDQGVAVSVVSALSDSTTAKIYLAVRDRTGSRIADEQMEIDGHIKRRHPKYEGYAYSYRIRCVGYDPESRTALVEATYQGGAPVEGEDTIALSIERIQPGCHAIETAPLPQSLLNDLILETQTLTTGETVLKPGQTSHVFEGEDFVSLSSMGFGSDGRFHILLALADGVDAERTGLLTTLYSKSSDDFEMTKRYNRDIQAFGFSLGGRSYYEISVLLEVGVWDDLELDGIYGTVIDRPTIEGKWNLEVKLEQAPQRSFAIQEKIGGITYQRLAISALGLDISGNPPSDEREGTIPYNMPVSVLLADGTVLRPKHTGSGYASLAPGDRSSDRWEFADAVDVEQITGVSVGYWMIPIKGESAGPGYWLKELS